MFQQTIILPNINDVYDFHKKISVVNCNVDLNAQNFKYAIDAKSLMGILSMDLTNPVILTANTDDPVIIDKINKAIEGKILKEENDAEFA